MDKPHYLAKVYLCHPSEVGLPTRKRDLYHPPPLSRDQIKPFSNRWGIPISKIPKEWGSSISPILLAMHLEVEGTKPESSHTETIIQYLLWNGGDRVLRWLILMAKTRPPTIPRRTFFWYLKEYKLNLSDLWPVAALYPNHRENWEWTLKEVRDALIEVDTLALEWYRLNYLMKRQ